MAANDNLETTLLEYRVWTRSNTRPYRIWILASLVTLIGAGIALFILLGCNSDGEEGEREWKSGVRGSSEGDEIVEAEHGVVAADDGRCSEIGASVIREGGHAVDAAVATALCLGVVNPMSSGIGGGAFLIVRSSDTAKAVAFDCRETAPLAANQNMYAKNPSSKSRGALSMGVPGELAGLHMAWSKYGRLPWNTLLHPSIKLARDGFLVAPYLGRAIKQSENLIMGHPGLRQVFAPNGKLLKTGDLCYNPELAHTLEAVSMEGPQVFYNGSIGEAFVKDVRDAGGILTVEDLSRYKVEVMEATTSDVMGFRLHGMPPPSSGTVGMSLVLKILGSYGTPDAAKGTLGLHRLVESLKHMFAIRMDLGDPEFVNVTDCVNKMLSSSLAEEIRKKIFDNTTFGPGYYLTKWSQLRDHGTSHFGIVDADRNAVAMTSTVNYYFGAGMLSSSTGIVINNEMDDFSTPTEITPDKLPPAPSNFIEPGKRPLSSMTPIIVVKENQLAGVVGGSGGMYIIPAVTQVFLNHFILGMEPLAAVQHPRVYHELIPNVVIYENLTVINGEHIELSKDSKAFLEQRGHQLVGIHGGSVCQLVVHELHNSVFSLESSSSNRRLRRGLSNQVFHGMLTAVSDPRKDGRPSGM